MRVLHAPIEIAGQATLSVLGLREIGVHATALTDRHQFAYATRPDVVRPASWPAFARVAAREARRHDVLHFHFGLSFLPVALPPALRTLDARALSRLGKRVVVEFLGSDVRMPSVERARNPDYVPVKIEDDRRAVALMRAWSRATRGHAIVCDRTLHPFLEPYFEHLHVVGQRVDTRSLAAAPPDPARDVPLVVHAPSDQAVKGTAHVRRAVAELRARGVAFEYDEASGVPQPEARRRFARADLVIDQLCMGAHGVFAVEAMSLAKPVVCNLLPGARDAYPPGLPLIEADPRTLPDVLERWLAPRAGGERHRRGLESRAFAQRHHDVRVVARRLLEAYRSLPVRGA